jgi:hypothetical protein
MTEKQFGTYSIASSVISGISGVMGAKGQGAAARANIAAKSKAIGESISQEKSNYITRLESSYNQQQAIDRQLGDALSLRGIEAMKASARLRAAGASTGVSGVSIEEVSKQAGYDELFDMQVLTSRARTSKDELAQQRIADFLNFRTSTKNLAGQMSGQMTTVPSILGALTSGLGSGLDTYMQYQNMFGLQNRYNDMMSGVPAAYEQEAGFIGPKRGR